MILIPAFWALGLVLQGVGNDVAGRVNDEVITWQEVRRELPTVPPEGEGGKTMLYEKLRELVEERVVLQEAKKLNIKVDERDIDKRIEEERARFPSKERFDMYLRFRKLEWKEYREAIRRDILEMQVIQYKYREWISPKDPNVDATSTTPAINEIVIPMEVREYYVSHRVEFSEVESARVGVLVLEHKSDEEKAKKMRLIKSLRRKIEEGSDFLAVAMMYTEGPRTQAALMGEMTRTTPYGPGVADLVFERMNEGDLSPVVERQGQLLIFFLQQLERREPLDLADATPIIRTMLIGQRRNANRRRLIDALINKAYVEPEWLFKKK